MRPARLLLKDKAFTRRLQELKEAYPDSSDPLLRLKDREFQHQNQHVLANLSIPANASKQVRDTAQAAPWTGEERPQDTVLRMLVDKHKPLRPQREMKKLRAAKDTVLDYQLNKNAEDDTFRELYREKFTPVGSLEKLRSLADSRIEQSMARGEFRNLPRGGKLDVGVGAYVDRTEHHLNNVLKSQEVLPPWIEQQGATNGEIQKVRRFIAEKCEKLALEDVDLLSELERRYGAEIERLVTLCNNSIRTYNLQSPLSTQKFYLVKQKEMQKGVDAVDVEQVRARHRLRQQEKREEKRKAEQRRGFFKWW